MFEAYSLLLILKRRSLPAVGAFISVLTIGMIATALKKPVYLASGELLYKRPNLTSSIINSTRENNQINIYNLNSNPLLTQSQIIYSEPIVRSALAQLQWKDEDGNPLRAKDFLDNLKVNHLTETDIISVSYQDENPQKAADAVNTLISVFMAEQIAARRAELTSTRKFLEQQLPKAKNTVAEAELALRSFQEKHSIISFDTQVPEIIQLIDRLQQQINEYKAQIAKNRSESDVVRQTLGMNSERAKLIANLSQSPAIQEVIEQLQQIESQLAQDKTRYTDNNPIIIDLEEKAQALRNLLAQRIENVSGDRLNLLDGDFKNQNGQLQQALTVDLIKLEATNRGLLSQIEELSQANNQYQTRIKLFSELEQQLNALQREVQVSQSTYLLLLQKLQEVRIAENQNTGNFSVVAPAVVPEEPIADLTINYLASAILATIVAAATVYLLEILDKSIKTLEEAEQIFGYTCLGIIPSVELSKLPEIAEQGAEPLIPKLFVRDYPNFAISKSYWMLQSNLRFLSSDKKIKTIVVTSSLPQEGKSTISANLASAIAQVGHRVLLIDGNLHHPQQHRIWNLYNNCGLSNLIAEQIDPRAVVKEVTINLDVLSSGIIPPSPVTLLDSQRMSDLIDFFAERYDFVIIDTPALNVAADVTIIGRIADGVLLVVKPGVVVQSNARFAKEILEQSGQNVLGLVVNGVSPNLERRRYYYHTLEHKPEKEKLKLLGQSQEELWRTVSRLARESQQKTLLNYKINPEELERTPVEKLKEIVNQFQGDLDILSKLVKEQEEELSLQRQTVEKLQRKLNVATDRDRFSLEQRLAQEEERKSMLDETLVGQRRNLAKRKEILRQYQQILSLRQSSSKK